MIVDQRTAEQKAAEPDGVAATQADLTSWLKENWWALLAVAGAMVRFPFGSSKARKKRKKRGRRR